ncbi:hypothetical protein VB690_14605 [Nodularia spumigena CH309]|nr:hypothetical protein [Nodularia spumigena CH309]
MLIETTSARDEAKAFLKALEEAKSQSERHLVEIGQPDHLKLVTGRSAMDNAILSTKRLIETYDRVLGEMKANLSDEDLALLDEPGLSTGIAVSVPARL